MSRRIRFILQSDYRSHDTRKNPWTWKERMLFFVKNRLLHRCTGGMFPGGLQEERSLAGEHPAFLLEKIGNFGFRFCPCTSRVKLEKSYIPGGTETLPGKRRIEKTTYILHDLPFNPDPDDFAVDSWLLGIVPEDTIVGAWRPRRGE